MKPLSLGHHHPEFLNNIGDAGQRVTDNFRRNCGMRVGPAQLSLLAEQMETHLSPADMDAATLAFACAIGEASIALQIAVLQHSSGQDRSDPLKKADFGLGTCDGSDSSGRKESVANEAIDSDLRRSGQTTAPELGLSLLWRSVQDEANVSLDLHNTALHQLLRCLSTITTLELPAARWMLATATGALLRNRSLVQSLKVLTRLLGNDSNIMSTQNHSAVPLRVGQSVSSGSCLNSVRRPKGYPVCIR